MNLTEHGNLSYPLRHVAADLCELSAGHAESHQMQPDVAALQQRLHSLLAQHRKPMRQHHQQLQLWQARRTEKSLERPSFSADFVAHLRCLSHATSSCPKSGGPVSASDGGSGCAASLWLDVTVTLLPFLLQLLQHPAMKRCPEPPTRILIAVNLI